MEQSFNATEAQERFDLLDEKLAITASFTLEELIERIEQVQQHAIEIIRHPLPAEVNGCVWFASQQKGYFVCYNAALPCRLANRAILHELAHIVRGDVQRTQANRTSRNVGNELMCYQRRTQLYSGPEAEVEFIGANWLERLVWSEDSILADGWLNLT
jgi:hypothetical protein